MQRKRSRRISAQGSICEIERDGVTETYSIVDISQVGLSLIGSPEVEQGSRIDARLHLWPKMKGVDMRVRIEKMRTHQAPDGQVVSGWDIISHENEESVRALAKFIALAKHPNLQSLEDPS